MLGVCLGYLFTCFFIYKYFDYIENSLNGANNIENKIEREEALITLSNLLNIHNVIITITLYILMIAYWIYFVRCCLIKGTYLHLLIIYCGISILWTMNVVKKHSLFIKCTTKFEHIIHGIVNKKLKGL